MIKKNILAMVLFLGMATSLTHAASAASFQFNPTTTSSAIGDTVTIQINIDTGTEETNGANAIVKYDSTLLDLQSINNGSFYSSITPNSTTPGKAVLYGVADVGAPKKGTGLMGTVVFKTKTNGSAALSFDCTSAADSSGIYKSDVNATNIINCSSNNTSTITIGSGGSTTNPTPTSSVGSGTTNPIPTQLPQTGTADNLYQFAIPGIILLMIGSAIKFLL